MMNPGRWTKQSKIVSAVTFLAIFFSCAAAQLHAQPLNDPKTVVAAGYSRIYANVEDARGAALAESIRFAVHKAALDVLFKDQLSEDFEIISNVLYQNPGRFIHDYRILKEIQVGRTYRVLIRATVLPDRIKADLSAAGLQTRPDELPTILFMVSERHLDRLDYQYWWRMDALSFSTRAASPMAAVMMEHGYPIIDPLYIKGDLRVYHQGLSLTATPANYEAAVFARRLGAHIVVLGTAEVSRGMNRLGDDLLTYTGQVNLRAIDTKTGQQLTTLKHEMIAAGKDPERTALNAMGDAAYQAGRALSSRLEALWRHHDDPSDGISIVVSGRRVLPVLEQFRQTISGLRNISTIRTTRLSPDAATLWVDFKGTPDEMVDQMLKASYGSFGINVTRVSNNEINIEVIRDLTSEILSE